MSQPSFFQEGTTPRPSDTRLRVMKKWLGALINAGAGTAVDAPLPSDTIKTTEQKINRVRAGL